MPLLHTMRKALPILAFALLVGAFLLLRLPSRPPQESAIGATIEPVTMEEPEHGADLVAVADVETRDEVKVGHSQEATGTLDPPEEGEYTEEFETSSDDVVPAHRPWILELRVIAPVRPGEAPAPVDVRVRARLDGDPFAIGDGVSASCAIGQITSIDIGSFRTGAQEPAMLSVTATHPMFGCDPMTVELIAEHVVQGEVRAPVQATLQLARAMTIFGRVRMKAESRTPLPDGRARIGVWKSRGGQPVGGSAIATEWTNDEGGYRVRIPAAGQYFVAAVQASSLADGESCEVTEAVSNVELRTLLLGAGATIKGQFVAGKGPPSSQVNYSVSRAVSGPQLKFGGQFGEGESSTYVWTQGRLLPSGKSGRSEADGSFTVEGLEAGMHELKVLGLARAHLRSEPRFWNVQAPASNLRFDLGLSRVTVRLVPHPSEPYPSGVKLFLTRPQGTELGSEEEEIRYKEGRFSTGEDHAEFHFTPQAALQFRLTVEGAEEIVRDLISPRSGDSAEVVIDVPHGKSIAFGSLLIELIGVVPPDGTSFVVHANQLAADGPPSAFRKTSDDHAHVLKSVDGKLLIPKVPAGLTRLAVYPATWVGHRASHHLDTIADVTIEEDLQTTAILKLVLGGRLRISKPDGAGGFHSDKCIIRPPGGDPITVQFIAYAANGGGAWGSDDSLLGGAPSLVMPNLEPGTYEVQVGDDTRLVSVHSGEIIDVIFE